MRKRILLASDIHNCHLEWYGISNEERMERFVRHMNEEYIRDPYDIILFLGDYSLDHWKWNIQGCYIKEGVSRTNEFVEKYCTRLPTPFRMIAGNHEQYGYEKWREITGGYERQDYWKTSEWLFILLDSYGADLDPTEHSDGTFTPIDTAYVRKLMEAHPECKVVLCGHHFDYDKETDEGRALLEDERIICLASGHVHLSDVLSLPCGKKLLRTGNYSYCSGNDPLVSMWGYREVILTDDALISRYITPENDIVLNDQPITVKYASQDETVIPLK